MANRLSHSSIRLYNECAKKYDYHYNQKLREKVKSGALFFGSALDKAFETLLHTKDQDRAREVFQRTFTEGDINGEPIDISTDERLVYSKTDFDKDIVPLNQLEEKMLECGFQGDPIAEVERIANKKQTTGHWGLSNAERKFSNYANWLSLREKGLFLLQALYEDTLPQITEVIATQKSISLSSPNGDSIIGYPDLVCKWKDGRIILFDLKTSSRPYELDSVRTSQQLAIYDEALRQEGMHIDAQGFIVAQKKLNKTTVKICSVCNNVAEQGARHKTCNFTPEGAKRCNGAFNEHFSHKAEIQYVIDVIPERAKEIIIDNLAEVSYSISNGSYPRNFNACEGNFGRCAFYDLCWKNKSDNLVKMEK